MARGDYTLRIVAWLLISFLGVSGCGLVRTQIANSERDRIINETRLAVESSRELDPIRAKVWMGGFDNDPPLSMFTLAEKATDAEKPAIDKWHEIVVNKKTKMLALAQQYDPLQAGMVETLAANYISLIVELYSQNISYGEYNKKSKDAYVNFSHQFSDMRLRQSLVPRMTPPPAKTSFSCYTIGNQTTCN